MVCVCSLRTQQGAVKASAKNFVCLPLATFLVVGLIPLATLLPGHFFRQVFVGEFDPGSGRTLAACLTHASRAERPFRGYSSGERVSNT